MLIPVGLERNETRRIPWISFAVVALNVLIFLAIRMSWGGFDNRAAFEDRAEAIERYLVAHPYLPIPQQLEPLCPPDYLAEHEQARQAYLARNTAPPADVLRRERLALQEMVTELFSAGRAGYAQKYGFIPKEPRPDKLLNSLFLHAGWMHLIGNMLFFLATAPFLEDVFGRILFPVFYLLSGVVAAYTHLWQYPDSETPLVGASGAIAGVMGAFLVRLGTEKIRFLFLPVLFLPFLRFSFLAPAFIVLPLWFLGQLVSVRSGNSGGVALWAHIGGFVFGVAVALGLKAAKVEERYIHPKIESEIGWSQHPSIVLASDARRLGSFGLAKAEIRKALQAEPTSLDAWAVAVEIALDEQDAAEIARTSTRLLELYLNRNETELASGLVRSIWERGLAAATPRYLVIAGGFLEKENDVPFALDHYKLAVQRGPDDPSSLRALLRGAEILRERGQTVAVRSTLQRALAHPSCVDQMRERVEKLLAAV